MNSDQPVCSSVCPQHIFFGIHLLAFLDIGEGGSVSSRLKSDEAQLFRKVLILEKKARKGQKWSQN